MSMQGAWNHFRTITRHRHLVIRHCWKAGIFWQGLRHDLSKYSPTEFLPGARYYQGNRSPNEKEREVLGYSVAWMHHKGRNKHHFEYWNDYNPKEKRVMPVKMPARYLAEMFCDRLAASKVYAGDQYQQDRSLRYFQNSNARKRGMLHPETEAKLMELLEILAQQGEEAAFAAVRELVKKGY
ncbi:MAG: DUF5662 family protein [Ruminococcus sp.]|nr:DUF5662 family protein [Ruminococcus sp.]CDE34521.1 putative uncharacterized protein [Ruminococcus sp. CAG:403]